MTDLCAAPTAFEEDGRRCASCNVSEPMHFRLDHPYQPPVKERCGRELLDPIHLLEVNTLPPTGWHAYNPGRTCDDCGGTGLRDIPPYLEKGTVIPVCPTCHGTRVVPKEERVNAP